MLLRKTSASPAADVTVVFQEALRYFQQTTKQKEMLEFALNYLQTDDEVSSPGCSESREAACFGLLSLKATRPEWKRGLAPLMASQQGPAAVAHRGEGKSGFLVKSCKVSNRLAD